MISTGLCGRTYEDLLAGTRMTCRSAPLFYQRYPFIIGKVKAPRVTPGKTLSIPPLSILTSLDNSNINLRWIENFPHRSESH